MTDLFVHLIEWKKRQIVEAECTAIYGWSEGGSVASQAHSALEAFALHDQRADDLPVTPLSEAVAAGLLKFSNLIGGEGDCAVPPNNEEGYNQLYSPELVQDIWNSVKDIDWESLREWHYYLYPDEMVNEFDHFKEYLVQWLTVLQFAATRGMGIATETC